jgi:hypothetical protein
MNAPHLPLFMKIDPNNIYKDSSDAEDDTGHDDAPAYWTVPVASGEVLGAEAIQHLGDVWNAVSGDRAVTRATLAQLSDVLARMPVQYGVRSELEEITPDMLANGYLPGDERAIEIPVTVPLEKYSIKHLPQSNMLQKVAEGDLSFLNYFPYLPPIVAANIDPKNNVLQCNALTMLSPETVQALRNNPHFHKCTEVILPALRTLAPATANELVQLNIARLSLDGLETLSPATAEYLAGFSGALSLPAIQTLTPQVAKHLSSFHGKWLTLGLENFPSAVANEIGMVHAKNLTIHVQILAPSAAKGLAQFRGTALILDRVCLLCPEAAAALASLPKGVSLYMDSLCFSTDIACSFRGFSGKLFLRNAPPNPEMFRACAACEGATFCFLNLRFSELDADTKVFLRDRTQNKATMRFIDEIQIP